MHALRDMNNAHRKHTPVILAILPFENLSAGNELDIFCKSFCIDLITELSRFRQIQIISYDSVRDIGLNSEMGEKTFQTFSTDYFVRGSFRHQNQQIRINIQLTDSVTHHLVWADRFSGPSDDLLTIQENVLLELVSTLQSQLNYDLLSTVKKKPKTHLKAYECWLYGIEELKKGSFENDLKAREYFQQAIDTDPSYSLAYSGMSLTYFNEWSCQLWDRWELSQNGAFGWAQKAIELDEQNYVAAYVLGRVFLYQQAFETAEHYLRKSLRLNSNDPESLIQIALSFVYLGYTEEAFHLYEKALRLNPAGSETYYPIGAIALFELGNFEQTMSLVNRLSRPPYVDFQAYAAAVWYELGDEKKMNECLEEFLSCYSAIVNGGKEAELSQALSWMNKINPYKKESRLQKFWTHVLGDGFSFEKADITNFESNKRNSIEESTDFWNFTFSGKATQLVRVKGFIDIRELIKNTGTPIHCSELMEVPVLSGGEDVIDAQAKAEYRQKILALQTDISTAEDNQDFQRAEELQDEYEQLIEHLSSSLGLRGNVRQAGNPVEKARSAVTWRIRNAISKIEQGHPLLGKHLSNSIKTGTFCSYEPEIPVEWALYSARLHS